jgi:hypothetical protein
MKTKLLTICLLLISSQVFAGNYTQYSCCYFDENFILQCPVDAEKNATNCNKKKCRKLEGKYIKKINFKVNVAQQKVLMTRGERIFTLGDCSVIDKKNWVCERETKLGALGSNWLNTKMKDGVYTQISRDVNYGVRNASCGK